MKNDTNYTRLPKLIFLYLIFISFYGTIAIFVDNPIFKLSKDVILILIGMYYLFKSFLRKKIENRTFIIIAFLLLMVCISILNLINPTMGYGVTDFAYGIKTTIFPMIGLLLGMFLKQSKMNFVKPLYIVFFLIIITWVLQRIVGLDTLMSMGFEYAVNVKTFNDNLRLPSLVGTPDAYAFLLSLTGILIEWDLRDKNKKGLANIFRIITLVFLLLATIRSAIIFWLVYQIVAYLKSFFQIPIRKAYITIGAIMFLLLPIMFGGYYLLSNTTLGSSSSTQDRLSHWGDNLAPLFSHEGIYGKGIGSVGAASVSTAELSSTKSSYAVDNQFFAIYEQLGIMGVITLFLIFSLIIRGCFLANKNNYINNGNALIVALTFSSTFTNCLELYPFNVFLWIQLGISYRMSYPIYEVSSQVKQSKKRKKIFRIKLFETPDQRIKRKLQTGKL
ncbi:hypothetical protein P4594_01385 [Priestia megaterium]|uniref:hypothetical protein n=1 Tax=Priestia megaterium TaxID=1404 RepID=UPI0003FD2D5E|nr:hypothetical protein [Priestia megaterium]MED3923715.1 hypothetical protein [Priestia megaterium]